MARPGRGAHFAKDVSQLALELGEADPKRRGLSITDLAEMHRDLVTGSATRRRAAIPAGSDRGSSAGRLPSAEEEGRS